jgi:NitT/TauT family transport system substrate-binding protein
MYSTTGRLSAALAGFLIVACATAARAEPPTLKVGFDTIPTHLAPVIFKIPEAVRHYGKDYTIEFTRFRGSALQLQAIASGEVDLGVLAFSSFATGIVNAHLPIKAVADVAQDGPWFSTVYCVRADSPIKSLKDLKGATIAVNAFGGAVDLAARSLVLKQGLKPNTDVNFIEANFANEEAMLRENKIQVAGLVEPFWSYAEANGQVRQLFTQSDGLGTTEFLFFGARQDVIAAKRDLLVKFFADYINGIRYVTDPKNRDRVLQVVGELNNQPASKFAPWALLKGKDYYHDPDGLVNVKALQSNVDELAKLGEVKATFDVRPHIDNSLVEDARKGM